MSIRKILPESNKAMEVYFDDFTVTHSHPVIVKANDYYPSNRDRRRELSTPNFRNGGERFTPVPVITHSFPPVEYGEVTGSFLAQVNVTGLYRTVEVQRRVHRINRALIENRVKTGKYIGSWRIIE